MVNYKVQCLFDIIVLWISPIWFNPLSLTASGRIYPSKWHQGHGHQKESQHRYFWMDVHNQGIVGKVLFCSKRGCLYFWNRFRNDDVARLRSLNSARCPRSIAITAAAALNSGAGLLPWQLVVLSTKCKISIKKPPRIESRKNELRSCSTAEEQLVSALKAPIPDFASVMSCTRGIWDAFSSLFSRFAAQWKDLSNGGFFITIG